MSCINEGAGDDAILTCDSGTIATWAARHWTIRGHRRFYLSGNLATMAPGLPYAIAAQHAFPNRQVIAFVGDGGFAMLMAEFLTAVRHDLPIKVIINNNNSYGQILWEQIILGFPEYAVRHREPVADFAAWAVACGGYGKKVDKPGQVADAVRALLAHPGPGIVDCNVNPNEPPMPGTVKYEQAKHFTEAFLRGPAQDEHARRGRPRQDRPASVMTAAQTGQVPGATTCRPAPLRRLPITPRGRRTSNVGHQPAPEHGRPRRRQGDLVDR